MPRSAISRCAISGKPLLMVLVPIVSMACGPGVGLWTGPGLATGQLCPRYSAHRHPGFHGDKAETPCDYGPDERVLQMDEPTVGADVEGDGALPDLALLDDPDFLAERRRAREELER